MYVQQQQQDTGKKAPRVDKALAGKVNDRKQGLRKARERVTKKNTKRNK